MKIHNGLIRHPLKLTVGVSIALYLTACGAADYVNLKTKIIADSQENKAFLKNPRAVIGKYYEAAAENVVIGSNSFDDALEIQRFGKLVGDEAKELEANKSKVNDLRSKSVLLNEGMNKENAKANTLIKVIDVKIIDEQSAAVRALALNKKFAGGKWWIGSETFILEFREIPCPVQDAGSIDPVKDTPRAAVQPRHRKRRE